MTSWKELTKTRKSIMSLIEFTVVLMGLSLLAVVYLGYKALDTSLTTYSSESTLRQAEDQLENLRLGVNTQGVLQLQNLQSLSPLPNGLAINYHGSTVATHSTTADPEPNTLSWGKVRTVQDQAQTAIDSLFSSSKIWSGYASVSAENLTALQAAAAIIIADKKNKDAAIAQDVLNAAKVIHEWMDKPSASAGSHQAESAYLTETVSKAETSLDSKGDDPSIADLHKAWSNWMSAITNQLEQEQAFVTQKKATVMALSMYGGILEANISRWMEHSKTTSVIFAVLFLILIGIVIFSLQALKKNPHLNTMFTSKGPQALQAELDAVTMQIDHILSNVEKAWIDARTELKVVHHAIQDSVLLEDQVQQLKTAVGNIISQVSKGLQTLEHKTRQTDVNTANALAALLGEAQTQGARIQQSLEILADSGLSIREELNEVRKNIRHLMSETLALKQEGETLEESSETIQSET